MSHKWCDKSGRYKYYFEVKQNRYYFTYNYDIRYGNETILIPAMMQLF